MKQGQGEPERRGAECHTQQMESGGTRMPYRVRFAIGVAGRSRGWISCRKKAGPSSGPTACESSGQAGAAGGREVSRLFCCDLNPSPRPHCRQAAGVLGLGSTLLIPLGSWFPPTGTLTGTLISLFPLLLLSVNVLLGGSLDLLDPGRPGGEAERWPEDCQAAPRLKHIPQPHTTSPLLTSASSLLSRFPVIHLILVQVTDWTAN